MSALGQKQTFPEVFVMSALLSKADIRMQAATLFLFPPKTIAQ